MLVLNFTPFPVIKTSRLVLRQITTDDVNEIFFLRSDKNVLQYLGRAPAIKPEDAERWIKSVDELQKNNEAIVWGITLLPEKKLIGTISLWNVQKEHYRCEVGYVLHPQYQRRGIMDEAMKAVLDFGFTTMKLHSIEANVNPDNLASIQLLEKNNFKKEGYFKENFYFNGKFSDSAIYSLINPYSLKD